MAPEVCTSLILEALDLGFVPRSLIPPVHCGTMPLWRPDRSAPVVTSTSLCWFRDFSSLFFGCNWIEFL